MKTVYAYSIVFRKPDKGMRHLLGHCAASSQQEARGWAHERFEQEHPGCELSSLLIREIVLGDDVATESPRTTPEFTLKPNF